MKCLEVERLLDDFVDGALPEHEQGAVARHLEGCQACREAEARLEALLSQAAALPHSLEPKHDLWPPIAARIAGSKVLAGTFGLQRARVNRFAWLAAAAAALVVASSVVTTMIVGRRETDRAALAPAQPHTLVGAAPESLELSQAQATFAAARKQLFAALVVRRGTLAPQTLRVVDENLKIINRAVAEMEAALARDPGNRELPALLVAAYQQEINLLQRVTQLPSSG